MAVVDEGSFDEADVALMQTPTSPQSPQVQYTVPLDSSRLVDVGRDVGANQGGKIPEHGLSAVQAWAARACNGAPPTVVGLVQEKHVVEVVCRFNVEQERAVTALLKNRRRSEGCFEAMRLPRSHHPTKRPRGRAAGLPVVRERIEPTLHGLRRPQACDEAALLRAECRIRDLRLGESGRQRGGDGQAGLGSTGLRQPIPQPSLSLNPGKPSRQPGQSCCMTTWVRCAFCRSEFPTATHAGLVRCATCAERHGIRLTASALAVVEVWG